MSSETNSSALPPSSRLHYLDAARAFALLLGVVFHASLSFLPMAIGWAVMDVSTGQAVGGFAVLSHTFRMALFFLLAGYFSHLAFHRGNPRTFLRSRVVRLGIPFVIGWILLRPLLVSGWIMGQASMWGEVDIAAGLRGGFDSLKTLPAGIFTGSHLWFLYYLMLITAMVLGVRAVVSLRLSWKTTTRALADRSFDWAVHSRWAFPLVLLPTAGLLLLMRGWGMDTPDQSLAPHWPALGVYGGFFSVGWILHRQAKWLPQLIRLTPTRLLVALLAASITVLLSAIEGDAGHPQHQPARIVYAFAYAATMWSFVVIFLGLARKFLAAPRPIIRYLADASYWIYLTHLPVVIWLQIAVAEIPLHWSLKWPGVCLVTTALCLASYELCVRRTPLRKILGGSRPAVRKATAGKLIPQPIPASPNTSSISLRN
jgi:peptidoglycan/LPS O-acetylase OafA/YrhL